MIQNVIQKVFVLSFPMRLAAIRKSKGFTQESLGEKIGLTKLQIYRYEKGASQPTLEVLKKLALTLHTTIDELAFEDEERTPKHDLLLLFEGVSKLDQNEQHLIKELIESVMLKHDAKRYFNRQSS